jgi:hypothetical protein
VKSKKNKRLVVRSQKDSKDADSKDADAFSRHQTNPEPAIEQTQREGLSWEGSVGRSGRKWFNLPRPPRALGACARVRAFRPSAADLNL